MDKTYVIKVFRLLIISIIFIVAVYLIKVLFAYLYPFVVAFLLAVILNPAVSFIEKKSKLSRLMATFLTISFFCLTCLFATFFAGIYIFEETLYILNTLPSHINKLLAYGESLINRIISFFNHYILSFFNTLSKSQQTVIMKYINELLIQLSNGSTRFFNAIILSLTSVFTSLSYIMTITLMIIFSLFFILKDFYSIKENISQLIPHTVLMQIQNITFYFKKAFIGFLRAQIIITLVTSLLIFSGLIILKIEHALTISLFAFFIDFIPYAGIGIIFIPWIFYNFFMNYYKLTIQLIVLYIILIIVRQLLEPKIVAHSIGINPLVTLIILFVSIKVWGVFGLIVSPIILILISTINHSGVGKIVWNYIRG